MEVSTKLIDGDFIPNTEELKIDLKFCDEPEETPKNQNLYTKCRCVPNDPFLVNPGEVSVKSRTPKARKCPENYEYCKYLSAETQRKLLFNRNEESITDSDSELESIHYAISSKWWQNWCDFVNIEFKELKDYIVWR